MAKNSSIVWEKVTLEGVTDDGGRIVMSATVESSELRTESSEVGALVETIDDLEEVIEDNDAVFVKATANNVGYVVSHFRQSRAKLPSTTHDMSRDDEADDPRR